MEYQVRSFLVTVEGEEETQQISVGCNALREKISYLESDDDFGGPMQTDAESAAQAIDEDIAFYLNEDEENLPATALKPILKEAGYILVEDLGTDTVELYDQDDHFLILTEEEALKAYDSNFDVYEMYSGGSEGLKEERDEIEAAYEHGGECAIELSSLSAWKALNHIRCLTVTKIDTIEDVKLFVRQMYEEGTDFNPDTAFWLYTNRKGNRAYTGGETEVRQNLLNQAWFIATSNGGDFYELCFDVQKELGIYPFAHTATEEPLPPIAAAYSQQYAKECALIAAILTESYFLDLNRYESYGAMECFEMIGDVAIDIYEQIKDIEDWEAYFEGNTIDTDYQDYILRLGGEKLSEKAGIKVSINN